MPSMTKAQRDAFLRETRIASLVMLNEDGSPNALPLWYDWDGERIRMFSQAGTGKLRRLERDPKACVSVADPVGALEAWVTVEGTVETKHEGGRESRFASRNATTRRIGPSAPFERGRSFRAGYCSS